MNEGKPGMNGWPAVIIPMIPADKIYDATPGDRGVEWTVSGDEIRPLVQNPGLSPLYVGFIPRIIVVSVESQP